MLTPLNPNEKILVGMSGGVDSSTAALLLKEAGWEVIGVTMLLWGGKRNGSSCSTADSSKAEQVANDLDIKLLTVDWTAEFNEEVISDFKVGLQDGKTLNPCISCNASFKVEGLVSLAREMGINYVATGHYVRNHSVDGTPYVKRGVDYKKDQSYVLYMVPEQYRNMFVFPLGELNKDEIREIADTHNLSSADAPDSMDLCFNPAEDVDVKPVPVTLMRKGEVLGVHSNGLALAVGQRKGVNTQGGGTKLYVGSKDISGGIVEMHDADEMMSNFMFFDGDAPDIGTTVFAQSSAHGTAYKGVMTPEGILFENPVRRTSPGQTVVLYGENELADCVVGGGVITNYI